MVGREREEKKGRKGIDGRNRAGRKEGKERIVGRNRAERKKRKKGKWIKEIYIEEDTEIPLDYFYVTIGLICDISG